MSIRGVDAQIMIARGPDFLKEASAQLKGGEKMQELIAAREQAEAERKKSYVAKTGQSPKAELHLGKDGGGHNTYESAGAQPGSRADADAGGAPDNLLDADVGPPPNRIDIKL